MSFDPHMFVENPEVVRHWATTLPDQWADIRWQLGDLIAWLVDNDHDLFVETLNHPAFEPGATRAMEDTARAFPKIRRRSLPWEYHEAVHKLPAVMADQVLDDAEDTDATLQDVRRAITEARGSQRPAPVGLFAPPTGETA